MQILYPKELAVYIRVTDCGTTLMYKNLSRKVEHSLVYLDKCFALEPIYLSQQKHLK